jgi:hypothetical protein
MASIRNNLFCRDMPVVRFQLPVRRATPRRPRHHDEVNTALGQDAEDGFNVKLRWFSVLHAAS